MARAIQYNTGDELMGLTVIKSFKNEYNKKHYGIFKCFCGNEFTTTFSHIKSGHTSSCGCFRKNYISQKNYKHGKKFTKEYNVWVNMRQRCLNSNYFNFKHWGGRGITICDEWVNSFDNFLKDMGEKPKNCRGLDRINNELGYFKDNCRWATQKEQANNTRRNIVITYNNISKSAFLWAQELNLNYRSLIYYFKKGDKSIEDIFNLTKLHN